MKICCISDTHGLHDNINLPEADMLIHCGDWTLEGEAQTYLNAFNWLCEQSKRYKYIIFLMGNHDFSHNYFIDLFKNAGISNIHYLENSGIEIENIKFYGIPNVSNLENWAFDDSRNSQCWKNIPDDVEVLISHSPPFRILDEEWEFGSKQLRNNIMYRLLDNKLKCNIFGHCHRDGGKQMTIKNGNGKDVLFVNCAICDADNNIANAPMILEI